MPTNAPIDPDRELADLANDLYDTLRQLAQHALQRTPSGVLDPTELVHQAWLRLNEGFSGMPRVEFLALCSTVMRRMAVDEARRQAVRDGGSGHERVTLTSIPSEPQRRPFDLLQLDRALVRLRRADERWARIVEMRFFGGLSQAETADALGVNERTVRRDWQYARAWLLREVGRALD